MREKIIKVVEILKKEYPSLPMKDAFGDDPYKLLVAVMLSARSRDVQTIPAARELFKHADSAEEMLGLEKKKIQEILKPIGFYRQKTNYLINLSKKIIKDFQGKVPKNRDELVELDGVGRKTANVLLSQYFGKKVIAVDTHVNRITYRLGWVDDDNPRRVESKLYEIVPRKYWSVLNHVLVRHGQELCYPRKPACDVCPVKEYCEKVGVKKNL